MYQIVINDFSDAKKQNISVRNNAENTKPRPFWKSSCALVCILYVAGSSVTITSGRRIRSNMQLHSCNLFDFFN